MTEIEMKERERVTTVLSQLTENNEDYHTDGNIHYSGLKSLDSDVRYIDPNIEFEPTEAMQLGSAFDLCMESQAKFQEEYKCASANKPTHTLGVLADALITEPAFKDIDTKDTVAVCKVCDELELWKSHKGKLRDEKLIKEFDKPEFHNYVAEQHRLKNIPSDRILSFDDYNTIIKRSQTLREEVYAMFGKPSDSISYIWQPIYRYQLKTDNKTSVTVSVKWDLLIVNHDNHIINQIDFKYYASGKNVYGWEAQYYRSRYDIQTVLYNKGLQDLLKVINEGQSDSYSIDPVFFFGIGCPNDERTLLFGISPKQITIDTCTGYETPAGYYVKGIFELINEYLWHMDKQEFTHYKEVAGQGFKMIKKRNSIASLLWQK